MSSEIKGNQLTLKANYLSRSGYRMPTEAEMEFAAALITLGGPEDAHREHVQKAMAGAKKDLLLAQNLSSTFRNQTISALLAQPTSEINK